MPKPAPDPALKPSDPQSDSSLVDKPESPQAAPPRPTPQPERAAALLREAISWPLLHPGALALMALKSLCLFICLLLPLVWLSTWLNRSVAGPGVLGTGTALFFLLGAPLAVNVCRSVVLGEPLSTNVFGRLAQAATLRLAGWSFALSLGCGMSVMALFAAPAKLSELLLVPEAAGPLAILGPVLGLWLLFPRLALAWLALVASALGVRPRLGLYLTLPQSVGLPLSAVLGVCVVVCAGLIYGLDALSVWLRFAGHDLASEAASLSKAVVAALGQAAALVPVAKVYARQVGKPQAASAPTAPSP